MKKILAIALAAVMVLGLATSALAVSWAAPAASTTASPFAVEVIKLGVNSDVTGGAYYTVLDDAAAYDYSTIYYAIKLSLPSVADANAYYGNSGFFEGNSVKVTIDWTNVAGKSTKVVTVPLTSEAQTLWFDGSNFTAVWQQTLKATCGCGESHILSAVASGTKEVSVKACVGAKGALKDVVIGGCYTVEKKSFKGIVPCVNCKPQNLSGFLFTGDCAAYSVFFSTNSAHKVTGAYAVDSHYTDVYYGAFDKVYDKDLYGWRIVGEYQYNCPSCVVRPAFALQKLSGTAVLEDTAANTGPTLSKGWIPNVRWQANKGLTDTGSSALVEAAFQQFISDGQVPSSVADKTVVGDLYNVYTLTDGTYSKRTTGFANGSKAVYAKTEQVGISSDSKVTFALYGTLQGGLSSDGSTPNVSSDAAAIVNRNEMFTGYPYDRFTGTYVYGDAWAYGGNEDGARLFQQTSATTINCDTNEAAYLNTLNHLYSLLGFTYADIAAGNVYMNEDILLQNFGFSTSICDTATWGAYTAAITVAPVTEVPATGVASFAGFAMIAIAGAAATVAKKRD